MLLQLDIKNYAIIEKVSVTFSNHLNVITGETGAGKSILLGALSLILGVRAGKGTLKNKNKKAIIEGTFSLPNRKEITGFFEENELDYAHETFLRREINASGKSRAFINDTPVTLKKLSLFSTLLVDLHQQFDTLQLGQTHFQLQMLDILAGHTALLKSYQSQYACYQESDQLFRELKEKVSSSSKEVDYNNFLLKELEEADFVEDELEELNKELQTQSHTEELKQNLSGATSLLEEDETAIISQLRQIQSQLDHLIPYQKKLPSLMERMASSQIELQDIADELAQVNEEIEYDEERISFIQDRLNTGYKLLKKHQLQTTRELLELQASLKAQIAAVENLDSDLEKAKKEKEQQREATQKLADKITQNRQKQIPSFTKELHSLLARVGMPNARIRVTMTKAELSELGQDEVTFEFDANKSGYFLPIRKVASGGELSRLMLCIKSLTAHSATLPTLIFDEIESGISGEAARQVGFLLQELATSHQVICISHQPQVAAKANTHFQVSKAEKEGSITSEIHQLSKEERIQVIAGMMSGDRPTQATLTSAKEMMEER